MTYATVLSGVCGFRPELGKPWTVARTFWTTNGSEDMRTMMTTAAEKGIDNRWGAFDLDGPLPPMITKSEDVDVRIPLGQYRTKKVAALTAHHSQVDMEDPFWRLMTDIETLGESFRLATGVPLPHGTATDLFEGLDPTP
jgi:N-acetyl-1-D-myo-inositol-2-amino-2-deoxy-alpha-D-glucopyranoside deacetylase